jgi:RHS repeat-associated protein
MTETLNFFYNDHLGSKLAVTDRDGNIISDANRMKYDIWGNTDTPAESELPSFTGKQQDASGLYYFNARYYDQETMRFLQEDPKKQDLSWYIYTGNNPTNRVDSNGKDWWHTSPGKYVPPAPARSPDARSNVIQFPAPVATPSITQQQSLISPATSSAVSSYAGGAAWSNALMNETYMNAHGGWLNIRGFYTSQGFFPYRGWEHATPLQIKTWQAMQGNAPGRYGVEPQRTAADQEDAHRQALIEHWMSGEVFNSESTFSAPNLMNDSQTNQDQQRDEEEEERERLITIYHGRSVNYFGVYQFGLPPLGTQAILDFTPFWVRVGVKPKDYAAMNRGDHETSWGSLVIVSPQNLLPTNFDIYLLQTYGKEFSGHHAGILAYTMTESEWNQALEAGWIFPSNHDYVVNLTKPGVIEWLNSHFDPSNSEYTGSTNGLGEIIRDPSIE